MTITALIPVPLDAESDSPQAPRPGDLTGLTVGIMYNMKPNGRELLSAIADLLVERYGMVATEPMRTEGVFLPSPEQFDNMTAACDVLLVGLGDCGSCSACSVHVAIDFERRGIPAAAICTTPFLKSGEAMSKRQGFAGYGFAMVEHPLSSLTIDELRERAEDALPQVLELFGAGAQAKLREGEAVLSSLPGAGAA